MKKTKKTANRYLQALLEFLNSDVQRSRPPRRGDSLAQNCLGAILARDAQGTKTDLAKLREELRSDIVPLLNPSKQRVKLVRVRGTNEKAFEDFSPEEILESVLDKAYQLRPRFVRFRVSDARRPSKNILDVIGAIDGCPFAFIDLPGKQFMAETVTQDSSARRVFYQILDAALRDGSFSKLRVCAKCNGFFIARRCSLCARKKRNEYMKDLMEKRRAKERKEKEQREREAREAASFKRCESFLVKARSGKTALQQEVFPIVKRLGGWNRINGWKGKRAADIWQTLGQREREFFSDEFS